MLFLLVDRYLISQHPEVEEQVVAELDKAGLLASKERPHPRPLEFEDLSRLPYLNACLKVCSALLHRLRHYSLRSHCHQELNESEFIVTGISTPLNYSKKLYTA